MKAFCSWSGGKECAMSFYEASKSGMEIAMLLNMAAEDGNHSRTHGLGSSLIRLQSETLCVPLFQQKAAWQTYEDEFKKAVAIIKSEGVETGIFGDIDLQEHRDWVERVCLESGIKPVLPLWLRGREELLTTFINAGFKAIIVATDTHYLGEEWLGREINGTFVNDLKKLSHIDLCGEKGEYHTFVYDGPIFRKPVEFNITRKTFLDSYCFLELEPGVLADTNKKN